MAKEKRLRTPDLSLPEESKQNRIYTPNLSKSGYVIWRTGKHPEIEKRRTQFLFSFPKAPEIEEAFNEFDTDASAPVLTFSSIVRALKERLYLAKELGTVSR